MLLVQPGKKFTKRKKRLLANLLESLPRALRCQGLLVGRGGLQLLRVAPLLLDVRQLRVHDLVPVRALLHDGIVLHLCWGCLCCGCESGRNGQNTGDGFRGTVGSAGGIEVVLCMAAVFFRLAKTAEFLRAAGSRGRCFKANDIMQNPLSGEPADWNCSKRFSIFASQTLVCRFARSAQLKESPRHLHPVLVLAFFVLLCIHVRLAYFLGYRVSGFSRSRQETERSRTRK